MPATTAQDADDQKEQIDVLVLTAAEREAEREAALPQGSRGSGARLSKRGFGRVWTAGGRNGRHLVCTKAEAGCLGQL